MHPSQPALRLSATCSTILFLLGALLSSAQEPAQEASRSWVDVTPSVVMAQNEQGSNSTCIALKDGLVFVDAGLDTAAARRFRTTMEQRFEAETIALLLTHGHIDHFLGMAAFSDVEVIAAAAGKELFERQLAIEFTPERIERYAMIFDGFKEAIVEAKPFMPVRWVDDEHVLGNKDSRLVFRNTGGHSSCSSIVLFEAEGVVVGGDLVQVGKHPYFGDPTTDMKAWIATLRQLETETIKAVCPGHGRVVDRQYLTAIRTFFEEMVAALSKLKADGVPMEQAVTHSSLPAPYWKDQYPDPPWWPSSIARLYQSL